MVFTDLIFLFCFLPISVLLTKQKHKTTKHSISSIQPTLLCMVQPNLCRTINTIHSMELLHGI